MVYYEFQNIYAILTLIVIILKFSNQKIIFLILCLNSYQIFSYSLIFIGKD